SFVFMAERFVGIANDAQERLVNVRVGSLQDAFVSFAGDKMDDPVYLNRKIGEIITTNETIKNFKVIVKGINTDPVTSANNIVYNVIASNNKDEIGTVDKEASFLFTLASGDPAHSVTIALNNNNERLFKTTRAITDNTGNVLGAVVTTQTLSLADIAIQSSITNSRILLFVVLALIMLLFFRLSKIIDYMDLYKKLKEVDQLKDDFVSMASHELRTPLSIIRGYADFMKEAPELSAETKDYVKKIDISAKNLDTLVGDMLDVSRIQQGRMSFEFVKINPSTIIEEVTTSLELPAKEKGLSISFDKTSVKETQMISVDTGRFKQILVNIIGNAVKYTKVGNVNVRVYEEKGRLYIRCSDTGVGMSAEEREKLFEKFYRIRNEDTKDIRGTGLGLWITAQMIKQMNGSLSVESIKGVGSHFIISFPLVS
ncbi:HAMP domain-containing histidine kinase, partial [Candidatus Nomurabacteria bacterium]|nr:HAMP domain-containing histidine kinase [Candidatus Nomurabacteria bacterium]